MKNIQKNKIFVIAVLIVTISLAGIATFTAIKLYSLRNENISPVYPSSQPEAASNPQPQKCTDVLSFALTIVSPTPTATTNATTTPTPTTPPTSNPTTPQPTQSTPMPLPVTGEDWPTLTMVIIGISTVIGSLILVL